MVIACICLILYNWLKHKIILQNVIEIINCWFNGIWENIQWFINEVWTSHILSSEIQEWRKILIVFQWYSKLFYMFTSKYVMSKYSSFPMPVWRALVKIVTSWKWLKKINSCCVINIVKCDFPLLHTTVN